MDKSKLWQTVGSVGQVDNKFDQNIDNDYSMSAQCHAAEAIIWPYSLVYSGYCVYWSCSMD